MRCVRNFCHVQSTMERLLLHATHVRRTPARQSSIHCECKQVIIRPPKVYWLNGMASTGKTTIAYSFSKILHDNESLGGTFFSSHLRIDTSDVCCIIPTISLQLAQARYLPSLSSLILKVVEDNPDCSS